MKNLFRTIFYLFILIVLFIGCSDSKEEKINNDSTIIELKEYLKKKLNKYSFQSDTTIHNYTIDFDEKNILISHTLEMPTITISPTTITKIIVPLKEIVKLYFEEKKGTEWLTIETELNKIGYSSDKRDNIFRNKVNLILKKEFRENDYNSLSSIIPAFHKIIITKCKKNHSLQSIDPFPLSSPKIDNIQPDNSKRKSNSSSDNQKGDFFDERSRIYSNPEYLFSFRVPKNWVYDYGIIKNNFFRAFQKDSLYSFTTNIQENKIYSNTDAYSTLDIIGLEKFTQNQINAYKSQDMDNIPFDVKVKKSYLQSVKAIRTELKLIQYNDNFNYEMSMLVYQFTRDKYLFSFVASAPTVFIDAGLIDLDLIMSYFQHLPFKQNKSTQKIDGGKESSNIEKKNNVTYYKDNPFTGEIFENYENGQLESKRNFKDGKPDGFETYYENGQLNGFETYFENGQLRSQYNFKDGKPDGLILLYRENGQLWKKTNYKDGKKDGLSEEYYENGKLKHKRNYKDGKEELDIELNEEYIKTTDEPIYYNGKKIILYGFD